MKQKVIFITYLCNYGGIETFVIRMTEWLVKNQKEVYIISDKDRQENVSLIKAINNVGGRIFKLSFRKNNKKINIIKNKFTDDEIQCVVFSYPGLILADKIFVDNSKCDFIFYDPHQYGLMMDFWTKQKIIKPFLRRISQVLSKRMYNNHQIIFMDKLCKERTLRQFKFNNKYDDDILLLPMQIHPLDNEMIHKKCIGWEFNILTICRMAFPFKGYVLGLVKQFELLCERYENITLTIIGDGADHDKLESMLNKLRRGVKEKIKWIHEVPYTKLASYFRKSNLYIGMGTTVVDAINYGVPALPVGSYTYECRGYGYFHVDATNLGGIHGEIELTDLINEILNMSEDEYKELITKDHHELSINYDIDRIGYLFCNFKNFKHGLFNPIERKIISIGKRFIK